MNRMFFSRRYGCYNGIVTQSNGITLWGYYSPETEECYIRGEVCEPAPAGKVKETYVLDLDWESVRKILRGVVEVSYSDLTGRFEACRGCGVAEARDCLSCPSYKAWAADSETFN